MAGGWALCGHCMASKWSSHGHCVTTAWPVKSRGKPTQHSCTPTSPHPGFAWVAPAGTCKCHHHVHLGTHHLDVHLDTWRCCGPPASARQPRSVPRVLGCQDRAPPGSGHSLGEQGPAHGGDHAVTHPPVSHTQVQTWNTSQIPPVNAQLVLCHEPGNDQTHPLRPATSTSQGPAGSHHHLPFIWGVAEPIKHPLPWHLVPQEPL